MSRRAPHLLPRARERLPDGAAVIGICVLLLALSFVGSVEVADAAEGEFLGTLPAGGGVAVVQWGGGSIDQVISAADSGGCDLRAVWVNTPDGAFVGHIHGAPELVNEPFRALYPAGSIPPDTIVILVCNALAVQVPGESATVVDVVDGDTIDVLLNGDVQRVRLILIDTPEVFGGVECYGRAASDFTKSLLPAGLSVWLERDVSETDSFGRLLRYVWLDDGRLVNEVLVAEGFATLATYPPDVKYVDRIRTAQQTAYEGGRGLWSQCEEPAPAPPMEAPSVHYANCTEARAAGVTPLYAGEPGYGTHLDRDRDGVGCE